MAHTNLLPPPPQSNPQRKPTWADWDRFLGIKRQPITYSVASELEADAWDAEFRKREADHAENR